MLSSCPVCVNACRESSFIYNNRLVIRSGRPLNIRFFQPHPCAFETIKLVQRYRDLEWLDSSTYDKWMSLNGFSYRLDNHPEVSALWLKRNEAIIEFSVKSVSKASNNHSGLDISINNNEMGKKAPDYLTTNNFKFASINEPTSVGNKRAKPVAKTIKSASNYGTLNLIKLRGDPNLSPHVYTNNELLHFNFLHHLDGNTKADLATNELFKLYLCSNHVKLKYVHVRVVGGLNSKYNSRTFFKIINKFFPFSSSADKAKTNLDAATLVFHLYRDKHFDAINNALAILPLGTFNITVTAILIHSIGNPVFPRMTSLVKKDHACCMMTDMFYEYFKSITTALRRSLQWPDGTQASLIDIGAGSYWEMCIGRSNNVTDWADEKRKRTKATTPLRLLKETGPPNDQTNDAYLAELRTQIDLILAQLIPATTHWESWSDFGERRQAWVSSGSAGAAFIDVEGEKVRLSKPAYFETITKQQFDEMLDQVPTISASGSEKFEQSKARAIYGTAPLDYAIMAYVIMPLENMFHLVDGFESSLKGVDEVASIWRRIDQVTGETDVECMMVDYTDFNYQHTLGAQSLLFSCVVARLKRIGACNDVVRAAQWCADACLNQRCKFPGDRKYSSITQGMFSGVRGTNFINTILNLAYFKQAQFEVYREFDLTPKELFNLHSGDDVWISNKSRLWNLVIYNTMKYNGFEFNDAKQLIATNTGEFLRVWYTKEGAQGYLGRAIGSLIQRPIQGTDVLLPTERAPSLNDQINLLVRRGLDVTAAKILWDCVIPHCLTFKMEDSASVTIPLSIAKKSHHDGGLDLGPPFTKAGPAAQTGLIPNIKVTSDAVAKAVSTHTSSAWIRYMSKQLRESFNAPRVLEALHESNIAGSVRPKDRMIASRTYIVDVNKFLSDILSYPVSRSSDIFFAWLSSAPPSHRHLDSIYAQITQTTRVNKYIASLPSAIEVVRQAINLSPFKQMDIVVKATGLPLLEAASLACTLCPKTELAGLASSQLKTLRRVLGDQVVKELLLGEISYGNSALCILSPTVLSLIVHSALDYLINDSILGPPITVEKWRSLRRSVTDEFVAYACSKSEWRSLCRY